MNIELYDENDSSKRDAFNEVTCRRFRDKRSETRATARGSVPDYLKGVVTNKLTLSPDEK